MDTTESQRKRLGDAVRRRRRAAHLTQAQLAELVDAHTQTIGNLERGIHDPKPELLVAIGRVLQMDTSTAALAIRETVDVIRSNMLDRVDELGEAQALMFVGSVWRYVIEWEPTRNGNSNGSGSNPRSTGSPTSSGGVTVPKPRVPTEQERGARRRR